MAQRTWRPLTRYVALAIALVGMLGGCAALGPSAQAPHMTATASATPRAVTPTPVVTNCQPDQLTLTIHFIGSASGHIGEMGQFLNHSNTACSLYGFPGAQMLDAERRPMTTHALWLTNTYLYANQTKRYVQLAPGGAAYFAVTWSNFTIASGASCPTASYLSVTPPNDFSVLTVPDQINACDSNLEISPVEPTAFMGW